MSNRGRRVLQGHPSPLSSVHAGGSRLAELASFRVCLARNLLVLAQLVSLPSTSLFAVSSPKATEPRQVHPARFVRYVLPLSSPRLAKLITVVLSPTYPPLPHLSHPSPPCFPSAFPHPLALPAPPSSLSHLNLSQAAPEHDGPRVSPVVRFRHAPFLFILSVRFHIFSTLPRYFLVMSYRCSVGS